MAYDALGTHARDELGIAEATQAQPLQAAIASAISFATGAAVPLAIALLTSGLHLIPMLVSVTLIALACLGALAAKTGGAAILPGALRVVCWSALAMGATIAMGTLSRIAVRL